MHLADTLRIGQKDIGPDRPTYFVADIAANHDGDLERAKRLIGLAAAAGADAAKFQNFRAETIVSDFGFKALGGKQSHQGSWKKSVFEVYQDASLPLEWTDALAAACADAGIGYFTAPYALDLVEALEPHVCAWKLGSGDITWHAMIERLARGGRPLLMATGASDMHEVRLAMQVAARHTRSVVLMQCNTNYTASLDNFRHINLDVLKAYALEFPGVVLGLSDHTPGCATVLGAVTLGARVIEKHFTDDTGRTGPDHKFSMDPASWREMVDYTRQLELALGDETKRVMDNERETVILQRRAVRAAGLIPAGTLLAPQHLAVLRPCPPGALPPYRQGELLDRRTRRDIPAGDVVTLADVD